jgi:hypothetical protein
VAGLSAGINPPWFCLIDSSTIKLTNRHANRTGVKTKLDMAMSHGFALEGFSETDQQMA